MLVAKIHWLGQACSKTEVMGPFRFHVLMIVITWCVALANCWEWGVVLCEIHPFIW